MHQGFQLQVLENRLPLGGRVVPQVGNQHTGGEVCKLAPLGCPVVRTSAPADHGQRRREGAKCMWLLAMHTTANRVGLIFTVVLDQFRWNYLGHLLETWGSKTAVVAALLRQRYKQQDSRATRYVLLAPPGTFRLVAFGTIRSHNVNSPECVHPWTKDTSIMVDKPSVILTGFADEAANQKTVQQQFSAFAAMGLQYYSIRFIDVGSGIKNVMKLTKTYMQKESDY